MPKITSSESISEHFRHNVYNDKCVPRVTPFTEIVLLFFSFIMAFKEQNYFLPC